MTRKRVVVGQSSITAGQMKDFWRKVEDGTICFANFNAFLEKPHGFNAEECVDASATIVRRLEINLDHSQWVEEGVKAGGYDSADPDITSPNFPHLRQGVETGVKIGLVQFKQASTTAQIEAALIALGERCDMDDQLALGAQHPDEQRKHPIVFLGASFVDPHHCRRIGMLGGGSDWRYCSLDRVNPVSKWHQGGIFAVRLRK